MATLPEPAADPRWAAVDDRFASASDPAGVPPVVARRALLTWTRLHGVLSLEVEGQFEGMAVDPESVFRAEVEALLGE